MIYTCEYCGDEYSQHPSKYKLSSKHYCSRQCVGLDSKKSIIVECDYCGKEFEITECRLKRSTNHYCSKECASENRVKHITNICEYCGKEYERVPSRDNSKGKHLCSKKCAELSRRNRIVVNCDVCDKTIEIKPHQMKNKTHCCSKECDSIRRKNIYVMICDNCGEEYTDTPTNINRTHRKFCSRNCYKEYRRNHPEEMCSSYKGRIELLCGYCGDMYTKKVADINDGKQYCSVKCAGMSKITAVTVSCNNCGVEFEKIPSNIKKGKHHFCTLKCRNEYLAGENHVNWQGGIARLDYGKEFNNRLKKLIRFRDEYTCQVCCTTEEELVEKMCVHHIDYNRKNNSNMNNLISLCRSCHAKTNSNREYWTNYFQIMMLDRGRLI